MKSGTINGHFTWRPIYIFDHISHSYSYDKNVPDKSCRENQKTHLCSVVFTENRAVCKIKKVKWPRYRPGMAQRVGRVAALLFRDLGTRRGQRHAPAVLYPRERPGTHCTGAWVGPRADLDRCGKSRPPPGFDPRTVQPVVSRYTDWATRPTLVR
jgi:hypothetical protein